MKRIILFLLLLPFTMQAQKQIQYKPVPGGFQKVEVDSVSRTSVTYFDVLDSAAVQAEIYGSLQGQYEMLAKKNTNLFINRLEAVRTQSAVGNLGMDNYKLYMKIYLDTQLDGKYFVQELKDDGTLLKDYNVTLSKWQFLRAGTPEFLVQPMSHQYLILTRGNDTFIVTAYNTSSGKTSFVGVNSKNNFIIITKK